MTIAFSLYKQLKNFVKKNVERNYTQKWKKSPLMK